MIPAFIFLYGLVVGSFINVCAWRIPRKQSIISPGSYCPHCKKRIKPYDNIPLVSYLILKGKCRHCKKPISARYPLVELTTAILFLVTYLIIGLQLLLFPALVLVAFLLIIFLIDLDFQIIPNGLIIFGLAAGFVFLAASLLVGNFPLIETKFNSFAASIGAGLIAALALLTIAYLAELILGKEAMGGGDIKLAAVLGLFLGPYVFLSLLLAFFVGAFVSVLLMSTKIINRKDAVPFGPFMAVGAVLTLYFGPQIWNWYLSLAVGK